MKQTEIQIDKKLKIYSYKNTKLKKTVLNNKCELIKEKLKIKSKLLNL